MDTATALPNVRETSTGFMFRCRSCKSARRLDVPTRVILDDRGRERFSLYAPNGDFTRPADYMRLLHVPGCTALPETPTCCNRPMRGEPIRGRYVADVPCTAKCVAAKGPSCDCSCGGKNHGGAHSHG